MLKSALPILALLLLHCGLVEQSAVAQSPSSMIIIISKEPKGAFAFTKDWAYSSNVTKDDNGKFFKNKDGKITSKDTAHLYFTAKCTTNVQGGYMIRYCHAIKRAEIIELNFSDGLPAYASEFNAFISKNKLSFKPVIIYPELIPGQKITYKVTKSRLTLYQKNYANSKKLSGYIDVEFIENTILKNKEENHKYYFRGYFKTPVNV